MPVYSRDICTGTQGDQKSSLELSAQMSQKKKEVNKREC